MSKWNLIVDVANCTNCNNCTLAVHDEHVGNDFPGYAAEMPKHGHKWIDIARRERGQGHAVDVAYLPTMCQHCDDAPCIKAARDGAIRKRDDGIVIIDPEKSKGQKQIVDACPYGAVFWNAELDIPQHWIFDAHLLDAGWQEPRCVSVCPTGALRAVRADDATMAQIIDRDELEALRPDLATRPRVHYKNLWRYNRDFVAGTVSVEREGVSECLAGAHVTLRCGGEIVGEGDTDGFGDFKLDHLRADDRACVLEITSEGYEPMTFEIVLSDSINLGDIRLVAAR
jgi:Fe-S-cluster-containing dehydrogenase component